MSAEAEVPTIWSPLTFERHDRAWTTISIPSRSTGLSTDRRFLADRSRRGQLVREIPGYLAAQDHADRNDHHPGVAGKQSAHQFPVNATIFGAGIFKCLAQVRLLAERTRAVIIPIEREACEPLHTLRRAGNKFAGLR